jgi:ABC-type amino acid transport substrate-binding protein
VRLAPPCCRHWCIRKLARVLALAAICLALPPADAASAAPAANGPLRVGTTPIAPFVLPNADPLAGFSVDV